MNKISKKNLTYAFAIIIIIIMMTYVLVSGIDKKNDLDKEIIITFYVIGIISVINIVRDSKPFSLNKVFWYFNFFFLFLAPLIQYMGGYYPWDYYIEDKIFKKCNLLIILWMLLYMFINIKVDSKKQELKTEKILKISKNEIKKSILYSFGAFFILALLVGVKNLFFRETNTIDIGSDLINSIVQKFLRTIPVFSLSLYIILTQKNECKKSKFVFLLLLTFVIILNFPTSMSRYWIGTVYLGIAVILLKKHIKNRTFDIAIIVGLAVIFPAFTLFKRYDIFTVFREKMLLAMGNVYYNVDFDAYSMFARIIMYTKEYGLEMGKQLSCSLFFFIPRAIWISKPYPTGVMVATKQGANFTNLSSPLISEAYIDFGILGVIIVSILTSYIISKLDNKYWKKEHNENNISIIEITYPFMIGFLLFLQRGSLQPVVTHAFSFYLYIILKYIISKFKITKKGK